MLRLVKINESFIRIENCDYGILKTIGDHFSFMAPNYFFSPKYKAGVWDGKIRLFNSKNNTLPIGLVSDIRSYLESNDAEYEIVGEIDKKGVNISEEKIISFSKKLLKCDIIPRDYQISALKTMLAEKKTIIRSATGSGKSFIAFLYFNILKYLNENFKFLLVVPTTSLVEQMRDDFIDYGKNFCDYDEHIHRIYSGKDKNTEKSIIISTWQSLQKMPSAYFEQFNCLIVDECHQAQAKQLSEITSKCINAEYKCGMSGTLKDSKVDKMQLTSLFGEIHSESKTKDLIKKGFLSDLKIFALQLKYSKDIKSVITSATDFASEAEFINSLKVKQRYVSKLCASRNANTLVLFKTIKLGKAIEELLKKTDKKIFYVDGTIDTKYREAVRKYCEKNNDAIIIASYGTFSTGINIKNLSNIVFAESMKSMIKIVQSIGRGLRLHKNKTKCFIFDLVDDLSIKNRQNYMLKHFFHRVGYYDEESFDYELKEIDI